MPLVKSSYGIGLALDPRICTPDMLDRISGSAIDRKVYPKKVKPPLESMVDTPLDEGEIIEKQQNKPRTLSRRTKSKIKKKILAFARLYKTLSFVTLTFVNAIDDKKAVQILHAFLDNVIKQDKNFHYIWVAEKQTKNSIFKDNIHFHIITNKFWKINHWWQYWLDLQARFGIVPRNPDFSPSSAFDVKSVRSNNLKGLGTYLTKYVTKNTSVFGCQIWNCSQLISQLYTDFYTDFEFIRQLERLERNGQLGGKIKVYKSDHCNVHIIPLNRTTIHFYSRLDEKNRSIFYSKKKNLDSLNMHH